MRDLYKLIAILYEELLYSSEIYSYIALPQLHIRTSHE